MRFTYVNAEYVKFKVFFSMVEYVNFKYLNEEHVQQIPLFVIFTSLNM